MLVLVAVLVVLVVHAMLGAEGGADGEARGGARDRFALRREQAALLQPAREMIDEGRHRADDRCAAKVVAEAERR